MLFSSLPLLTRIPWLKYERPVLRGTSFNFDLVYRADGTAQAVDAANEHQRDVPQYEGKQGDLVQCLLCMPEIRDVISPVRLGKRRQVAGSDHELMLQVLLLARMALLVKTTFHMWERSH